MRSPAPGISDHVVSAHPPCNVHAHCAVASPCIAVGVCGEDKQCTATAPRCRNLAVEHQGVEASSFYGPGFWPWQAADGSDATANSWCATYADSAPEISLTLPNEHAISLVRLSNGWLLNNFGVVDLRFEDRDGVPLLVESDVPVDDGQRTLAMEPVAPRANKVVMTGRTFDDGPCVGELELHGEYCFMHIVGHSPMTWRFRPGTPEPDHEIRYGLLSELHADGGFQRAVCLGRFVGETAQALLPDPPAGDGYYLLGRAFNVCADEQFGLSRTSPDPRVLLEPKPACIP